MARRVMRGDDSERATEANEAHDAQTSAAEEAQVQAAEREPDRPARRFPSSRVSRAERDRMLKDARGVKFPAAVRGYDRAAVDRYVKEVNRLIAELEISASPEAAVRHALDEVSEETREAAETRTRELARNAETVWRERRRLIEDMRAVGEQLVAIGDAEAKRFPPPVNDHPV